LTVRSRTHGQSTVSGLVADLLTQKKPLGVPRPLTFDDEPLRTIATSADDHINDFFVIAEGT